MKNNETLPLSVYLLFCCEREADADREKVGVVKTPTLFSNHQRPWRWDAAAAEQEQVHFCPLFPDSAENPIQSKKH